MKWEEVQAEYPNEWLIVEALRFHEEGDVFVGDDVTVVEKCPDGAAAFAAYRRLHGIYPTREFIFVHTTAARICGLRSGAGWVSGQVHKACTARIPAVCVNHFSLSRCPAGN